MNAMGFEWVIPVIVLILWVVNNVVRLGQEDPKAPPRPQPGRDPQRKPGADIDDFLRDIDRLRRKAAEQRGDPPPPPLRPRPVPEAEVVDAVPVRPRRVSPPPPPAPPPPPPAPVVQPPASELSRQISLPSPPHQVAPRSRSPVAAQVAEMMRTPESVRAAVIVSEILAGPRSRRPRSR